MNISKLFRIFLSGIAFCTAATLWAQDGAQARGARGQGAEAILEKLDLSDEQMEQVREVVAESIKARNEILAKHGIELSKGSRPDREAMRAARPETSKLSETTDAKLAEILSEEQFAKYKEFRAGNRPQGGGNRKGQGARDA